MKTGILTKLIILLGLVLSLSGCSFMGKQAPVWEGGVFTPDGKYYVYMYSVYHVTQYSQQGGITHRSGYTERFLQVVDCASGEKLLKNPVEFDELVRIGDVNNHYVWLSVRDIEEEQNSVAVFDLSSFDLKFSAEDIREKNPDIPFGYGAFFESDENVNQAVYEAEDGRKYDIDAETGKLAIAADSEGERLNGYEDDFYQYTYSYDAVQQEITGGSRRKLFRADSVQITSQDDFLDPQYLAIHQKRYNHKARPSIYDQSFFILSKTVRNNSKDLILTRINQQTLATVWSITLPQDDNEELSNIQNKCRFYLQGDNLLASNQSHLMEIDLKTGTLKASYKLLPPK
ncbi:hypothetical protein [Sinomicrobium sp.]